MRSKIIVSKSDTITLDTLTIIPETLIITDDIGEIINNKSYYLDTNNSAIILKNNAIKFPIKITYKVFPFDLKTPYFHKEMGSKLKKNNEEIDFFSYYKEKELKDNVLGLSSFQKDGSISRAVSVGNKQSLSVMSHMNLQIIGNISPELQLIASISDDNIPIQPDGNTQQLQDFDKVFIQLKHKNGQITAGDFEMKNPNSYFLRYHKKAQGANASVNLKLANDQKLQVYGGIALSRGKYARNIITGIEGNQGPYKLTGANFERAIIILSGTEKVYIDGKEMQRGQNYDYIINYNTSEISFTPKVPINKDSRISIEFQYSDRNYARYLANVGFNFSSKKLKLATHYYTETDLKDQALDQELTEAQLQLLYGIGDSLHKAISPAADSIGFNGDQVLYKKIDSLGFSPVYIHSTSADSAFYQLSFSMLGAGNGNYVQIKSDANGRVFKWVAPINGIKQGDYEPVVLLITPTKKQIVTNILEYKIFKNTKIFGEFTVSDEDLNLFSPYNDENNIGMAYKVGVENKLFLGTNKNWNLVSKADYEHIDKSFSPIERFRSVEFNRDWNIKQIQKKDQKKIAAELLLKNRKSSFLKYKFQNYWVDGFYSGIQNVFDTKLIKNRWKLQANISKTNTEESQRNTSFLRHKLNIEKAFSFATIGAAEEGENNRFMLKQSDTLFKNSYKYQQYKFYLKNADTSKHRIQLHYKYRDDYNASIVNLHNSMRANEFGLQYSLVKSRNNKLTLLANYRKLAIIDSSYTNFKPEETAMGRIEHFINLAKGSIRANSFFELGSGMESRKDFSYIEVAAGQGVYSWNDYNNNGVKELNEFEIAAFKDQANYIRIYMPSSEYVKTYNNSFSTSIAISPSRVWRKSNSRILKAISHFSNQLIFRSSLKTLNSEWQNIINPFFQNINDTALMSLNTSLRNTFYFNRGHSKYGIDYTFLKNKNKVLMMNGYQGISRNEHLIKFRWNINRVFLLQLESKLGNKISFSDFFKDKEFDIQYIKGIGRISYQPNKVLRFTIPISMENKENDLAFGGQKSETISFGLQAKYSMLSKGSWTASIESIDVSYSEPVNGAIAFEMLQGFMPGKNYTWIVNYQRNLMNNLQLNIVYNGRKSKDSDIIHIGSVQLRAFF